jgi:CheY-like chemotaxis protein
MKVHQPRRVALTRLLLAYPLMSPQLPDRQSAQDPGPGSPSVLLVDDDAAVRLAMRCFLLRRGWTVVEAADGACAQAMLESAAGREFDLVICDLQMPRLSGQDFYRWLAATRPEAAARLVFSSGDVLSPESAGFLSAARRPVLPKPFELSELARIVDEVRRPACAA